jgi:AAA family ATP:ADP antiporter
MPDPTPPSSPAPRSRRRGALDAALGAFAEVRDGEGLAAVLLMGTLFIILASYYVLKTVREGLILGGGMFGLRGDELKMYATGGMALLMLVVVPAYGRLASRVRRRRLLTISYAIVIGCLAVFFVLGGAGAPVGLAFYLWLGIINMFLIAQFWSFANDIYTEEEGKRLFAIVAIGGTAGAIVGPRLTKLASTFPMMAIAAGMLAAALALLWTVDALRRRARAQAAPAGAPAQAGAGAPPAAADDAPLAKVGGFQLVLRDRYLLAIAVMLILANLVNSTGEYILSNAVVDHAAAQVPESQVAHIADARARAAELARARGAVVSALYADFFSLVNLVGFLIQSLLVSRIIKYAGIRVGLFVLPAIALASSGLIGLIGGLALIRVAKVAENATDYSLQNTVRQSLFLPTSREVKYKAKAAIDTFFVRFGDTAAALAVLVGVRQLGLGPQQLALVNLGVVAIWIAVAAAIARRHRALEARAATLGEA